VEEEEPCGQGWFMGEYSSINNKFLLKIFLLYIHGNEYKELERSTMDIMYKRATLENL